MHREGSHGAREGNRKENLRHPARISHAEADLEIRAKALHVTRVEIILAEIKEVTPIRAEEEEIAIQNPATSDEKNFYIMPHGRGVWVV
jgi:ribosome maturation protein Sdo1